MDIPSNTPMVNRLHLATDKTKVSTGNWPTNVRPILDKVSHAFVIFYLLYITVIVFAVIRVISAIFLKARLLAERDVV